MRISSKKANLSHFYYVWGAEKTEAKNQKTSTAATPQYNALKS